MSNMESRTAIAVESLAGEEYRRDAFGRDRVSNPVSIFDNTFQYSLNDLIWFQEETGEGSITHLPNKSTARLEVGTGDGDLRAMQTKQYFRYEPGKSQLIMMSFVLKNGTDNCTKTVGYGDKENGIFFKQNNGDHSVIIRSKVDGVVSENEVKQEDWNLDKLDGVGKSGINFQGSKAQLLVIDLEWLSVGRVRVGFASGGIINYVHEFKHTNIIDSAYMSTANLPIRYEIKNDGVTDSNTSMDVICVTVISEGGQEFANSYPFSIGNGISEKTVGAREPILSIRPKGKFNDIINRVETILSEASVLASGNNAFVELVYSGSLTSGGTALVDNDWDSVDENNSSVEYNLSADGITGGIVINSFSVVSGRGGSATLSDQAIRSKLPMVVDIEGNNPINLSVVVTPYTGSVDVSGAISWEEIY